MDDEDCRIVVTERDILEHARRLGISISDAWDDLSWRMEKDGQIAFIPKAFVYGGYNEALVEEIADAFDSLGVDLHPIDGKTH